MPSVKALLSIVGILVILTGVALKTFPNEPQIITKTVERIVYREHNTTSYVQITQKTLEEDLATNYSSLSSKQRSIILSTIVEVSETYNISPLILYALISVESSFRPYITHPSITVDKKKTNAIGLGGIVYEWHGEELKKLGIIETKTDLYDPAMNIRSIGYVLNKYMQAPLKEGTDTKIVSALRRFFGSNFKSYSDRIKYRVAGLIDSQLYK